MNRREILARLRPQIEYVVLACGDDLKHLASLGIKETLQNLQVVDQGLELLSRIDQEFQVPLYEKKP